MAPTKFGHHPSGERTAVQLKGLAHQAPFRARKRQVNEKSGLRIRAFHRIDRADWLVAAAFPTDRPTEGLLGVWFSCALGHRTVKDDRDLWHFEERRRSSAEALAGAYGI